jgi:hypothetical protein
LTLARAFQQQALLPLCCRLFRLRQLLPLPPPRPLLLLLLPPRLPPPLAACAAASGAASTGSTDIVAFLKEQVAAKDAALLSKQVELNAATAAKASAEASLPGLLAIAKGVVGQMQVALGNTDSSAALDATGVVAEHARVLPVYKAKLPVGGVAQSGAEGEVNSSAHPAFVARLALLQQARK